jgi:hypothetical protein
VCGGRASAQRSESVPQPGDDLRPGLWVVKHRVHGGRMHLDTLGRGGPSLFGREAERVIAHDPASVDAFSRRPDDASEQQRIEFLLAPQHEGQPTGAVLRCAYRRSVSLAPPASRPLPPARHDDDAVLSLTATVAREAERCGETGCAAAVSQRVFNRVRVAVDRARGVDPHGPDRTPTANAIVMHFRARAVAPVAWADVVAAALAGPRKWTQWMAATRRSDPAEWLTGRHVAFALRLVADYQRAATVTPQQYDTIRARLVAEHDKCDGALLADVLPNAGQLQHFCDGWDRALAIAGLEPAPSPARGKRVSAASAQPAGMPPAEALAFYAALNGTWASYETLRQFARHSGFSLAKRPRGSWRPVVAAARELLDRAGLPAPAGTGPKPLGQGKRIVMRYPTDGIPGTAAYKRANTPLDPAHEASRHEFTVISVRVFLAARARTEATSRAAYVAWRAGTPWASMTRMKWSAVKREALGANRASRQTHGSPVTPEVIHRGKALRDLLDRYQPTTPRVPFEEAVRLVLAGPATRHTPPVRT